MCQTSAGQYPRLPEPALRGEDRKSLAFAGAQNCSSSVQTALLWEARDVAAVGCTFMEMARGGFKAGGPSTYPANAKFPVPTPQEPGASQS